MAKFVDVYGFNEDMYDLENMDNLIKVIEVGEDNFKKYNQVDKEIDLADYIVKGEEKTQKNRDDIVEAEYEIIDNGDNEREDGQIADLQFENENDYQNGLDEIIDAETINALENECGI